MSKSPAPPTAADLRALGARVRAPWYQVAARIGLHPVNLSKVLHEKQSLSPDLAARIERVLSTWQATDA